MNDEERRRLAAQIEAFDRGDTGFNRLGSPYFLGRVLRSGGTAPKMFAWNPLVVSGDEGEGLDPVLSVDSGRELLAYPLRASVTAGDDVLVHSVRNRLVQAKGANPNAFRARFRAGGCFFFLNRYPRRDVVITVTGSGGPYVVTTDADGLAELVLTTPGTYNYSAVPPPGLGFGTTTGSFIFTGTSDTLVAVLIDADASDICIGECEYPVSRTLTMTTFSGPHSVTYGVDPYLGYSGWGYTDTYVGDLPIVVPGMFQGLCDSIFGPQKRPCVVGFGSAPIHYFIHYDALEFNPSWRWKLWVIAKPIVCVMLESPPNASLVCSLVDFTFPGDALARRSFPLAMSCDPLMISFASPIFGCGSQVLECPGFGGVTLS